MVALKDFVTQALVHVATGVQSAQRRLAASGAQVNPPVSSELAGIGGVVQTGPRSFAQLVEFDLSVTTEGESIVVCSTGDQSGGCRLKFSVPVAFPADDRTAAQRRESPDFELAVDPAAALEDEPAG